MGKRIRGTPTLGRRRFIEVSGMREYADACVVNIRLVGSSIEGRIGLTKGVGGLGEREHRCATGAICRRRRMTRSGAIRAELLVRPARDPRARDGLRARDTISRSKSEPCEASAGQCFGPPLLDCCPVSSPV